MCIPDEGQEAHLEMQSRPQLLSLLQQSMLVFKVTW